ncbi:N-acetyl-gamma-glutamyl-phosphate reductase [Hydrotalea sp.]|uniref:N-acetyl-gamma-glutamyl-phosphate reductase n=1 Tax=Hydrotalea sp. TaxID=2881279 RepID=UPI003D13BA31
MHSKIKVGIIGGAGYTGGELIRLLLQHPYAHIHFVHSNSHAQQKVSTVHTDLIGDTDLIFTNTLLTDADVYFLCVGHGGAKKFLEENTIESHIKIIDLSQDFRLKQTSSIGNRSFIYGLPELNKTAIQTANNIANPGCFATTIELGLLPLANAGILGDIFTTGITGSTGAGQAPSATTHFSWRANNISAYKTLQHQHLYEIGQTLEQLQENDGIAIHFIPWRGDFTRGIFVSSMIDCAFPLNELKEMYQQYYKDAAFTHVSNSMIDLKQVVNTNKCLLHLEKQGNKLVIHSALDNLLKGASGQAVQNMNLMFGLPEAAGLQLKASAF